MRSSRAPVPQFGEAIEHWSRPRPWGLGRSGPAEPAVLLLDDPTVGVDVGSRKEILEDVRLLALKGNGVVLVSSEFEELSGLADRVLVMRGGAVQRVLDRRAGDDLSEEALSKAVQS